MLEYLLSSLTTGAFLVALVTGLVAHWLLQKRKYPPGPMGLPLVGNLLQMNESILHEEVFKMSKKYGPAVTLWKGTVPIVYVNKLDAVLEVLVKRATDYASRMSLPSSDIFTFGGKDIFFGTYSPTWKLHRRIAHNALRQYMQGEALINRINVGTEIIFKEIDKVAGKEFYPNEYLNFLMANLLTGICFGGKFEFDDKEVWNLLKHGDMVIDLFSDSILEDVIPGLRYVYHTKRYKQMKFVTEEILEKFMRKRYKEAERTFDRNNIRHFCDHLILARLEAEEEESQEKVESLTEDHLVQTLDDIFFAGTDSSRLTLNWAINHMIAFPDIQIKVQEEIDKVVGTDRLPQFEDRPDLAYTEAVLHESMRLATSVPLGVTHMTLCDTEVDGHKVPKNTQVVINHWALHNDPEAWDEADRFIPERFLDENGKLGPKPKNWLPFSAGKRVCLGEFVAKPELHLMFAYLMQRYTWKMKSGKCPDLTPIGSGVGLHCTPNKVLAERRI